MSAHPAGSPTFAGNAIARMLLLFFVAVLAACAHAPSRDRLATWVPSPNYNEREPILVVLHATEQDSVDESLRTLRTGNSGGPVSAHYLVGRDGALYQLVADGQRAWHAGPGRWGTITDVNSASIGIELDNNGIDPFPAAQIDALLRLLADICSRHAIPRTQVIGHADMAPTRKRDPGALFPWARLAASGFGQWPRPGAGEPPPGFDPLLALRALGYPLDDPDAAIHAFHLHYRGTETADTVLDADDLRILYGMTPTPGR